MRYDSDPYIVKKILTDAERLQAFLNNPRIGEPISSKLFEEFEPFIRILSGTLDHFAQVHALNPQLSVSRFSAHTIAQHLESLRTSITNLFSLKQFPSLEAQADWNRERFLSVSPIQDSEQALIALYKKLTQVLHTYYIEHVKNKQFAALLNEVVGWTEHLEIHGHHDIHAVILFAEKIARDRAVIDHRVEIVREICTLLQERSFLKYIDENRIQQSPQAALELSRIYSPYLLELYEVLLEDIEIIAISERDYNAFEAYCREHRIDIYDEYHDVIKGCLKKYVEGIALYVPPAFRMVKTATLIINAEFIYERYKDVETTVDVWGLNLAEDIRVLQASASQLKEFYPRIAQKSLNTMQKVKKLRREIVKPAIQVYSQYLKEPKTFLEQLSRHQAAEWIPILERAMACLEHDDDLYWKCQELKNRIDQLGLTTSAADQEQPLY